MAEFVLILSFKDIHYAYAYAYELRPIGHQTRRSGSCTRLDFTSRCWQQ